MAASGLAPGADGRPRCWWGVSAPDYVAYHDDEWGRPVTDDRGIYERLTLEAFQSGLSWLTILRKRENFRAAFDGFDFERVAAYGERDFERLMGDAGIVRNRAKIEAAIANARATLALAEDGRVAGRARLVVSARRRARARRRRRPGGDDRRVEGAGEGAQAARLPLRRPDHRLRADAGGRDRQRPHRGLLRSRRGGGASDERGPQAARPRDVRGVRGRRPRRRSSASSPTTSPSTARPIPSSTATGTSSAAGRTTS